MGGAVDLWMSLKSNAAVASMKGAGILRVRLPSSGPYSPKLPGKGEGRMLRTAAAKILWVGRAVATMFGLALVSLLAMTSTPAEAATTRSIR